MPRSSVGHVANVDVVRIAALVAIVTGHVYVDNEWMDSLIQSWRLPVFFVLSGYFSSWSRRLGNEMRIRAIRLLVPYLLWLVVLGAVSLTVRSLLNPDSVHSAFTGALLGGSYADRPLTTFWFFTALYTATVVYRLLSLVESWVRLSLVSFGLLVNILYGHELALVPYSVGSALGALVFLEVGRFLRIGCHNLEKHEVVTIAGVLLAVACAILIAVTDFTPIDMKSGQFPLLAVIVALFLCCAFVLFAVGLPQPSARVSNFMAVIARPTVAVIILHPMVLWVLRPESGSIPLFAVALTAFVLPLVLGLIIGRTRLSYPLLGVPQVDKPTYTPGRL